VLANDGAAADVVLADVVLGVVVAADVAVLFELPQPATIANTATSMMGMALNLMEAPFPLPYVNIESERS
jgi:hypothetical protein